MDYDGPVNKTCYQKSQFDRFQKPLSENQINESWCLTNLDEITVYKTEKYQTSYFFLWQKVLKYVSLKFFCNIFKIILKNHKNNGIKEFVWATDHQLGWSCSQLRLVDTLSQCQLLEEQAVSIDQNPLTLTLISTTYVMYIVLITQCYRIKIPPSLALLHWNFWQ